MRLALLAAVAIPLAVPSPSATLTVRCADGRSTYAAGEVIALDLEFNGSPDPDLYFSTETYDRSGRMGTERFSISPDEGVGDPLADYFDFGVGFVGGGLRSSHTLDGTPFHLRVNLNEWIRFTRPGRYVLTVRSRRLHRYSGGAAPELVSEPLPIDIVAPSPAWAAGELARARAKIASGQPDDAQAAVTILRYLDTRDAALELVAAYDRLESSLHFQVFAGLVQSPFRSDIVAAMEAHIDEGAPLPSMYLTDAALLRALMDVPIGTGDQRERLAARTRIEAGYRARWAAAALRGDPTVARFRGVLASLAADPGSESSLALAGALAAHPAIAADAFVALDRGEQRTFLRYRWDAIRDAPWTRAALEKVYRGWNGDYRFADVGDFALQRLLEIDPVSGRTLALEEIATGAHGVTYTTLSSLDGIVPPALDAVLQRRLDHGRGGNDRDVTLWLIARYGSRDLLPVVRRALGDGAACATEAAAIAYLLQHDPDEALPRLRPGFDRRRGCAIVPWREIAPHYWDDRLETAALAHAEGAGIEGAASAIQILGEKGSAVVKQPLLDRLARWSQAWRGRAADLDRLRGRPVDSPERIENALVNALTANPRLGLTAEDLTTIRGLCVTDACRSIVDVARHQPPR